MQDIALVVAFVGILVFLAHLFTGIFSRTRIPDVLLLIAIGICVGPILGLTSPAQFGQVGPVFTIITLIIILFESGISLRLSTLRSALGGAITLAPLGFFLTMAVVAGFALWFTDLELIPAFILGAIVGSTSETVVIPLVRQLKIREETQTLLSVESSLNDVLSIVITIALIGAYTLGEFNIASISGDLIASFIVAIFFGVIGAFLWSILLNRFHAIKNAMFTTPAFVFVVFGIVEILGFSGAIAALAFGVTIGNIEAIRFPFFKKDMASENINYQVQIPAHQMSICADSMMIQQVLINLIKNAMEAVKESEEKSIMLSADSRNEKVIIRVRDNGKGIDDEDLEKVFIPFYTTKKKGSGIGLSLSKQIMRLHKGSIHFQSDDSGTVFNIEF